MRTYISPIGYNSTSVTRPVLSRGIDSGDTIVLLRPASESDDSRATEAVSDVERMVTEIEPAVSLTVERIPHDDLPSAVIRCSDVIQAAEPDRIVNLGGGARDILLPFTIATLAHATRIDTVLFFSDIDGSAREWDLPLLTETPSSRACNTLSTIAAYDNDTTIPELTETLDRSKSTITRHVNELEELGAVETWREGKTKHVRSTLTGELLIRSRAGEDSPADRSN